MRLSKEDSNKEESGSISNQRDIILKYIKDNNLLLVNEYIDDGVSGTTFNREGFQKMIEDIEQKKINMVITKDLSRFGRNEGKQLVYLDFFAENKVRYVSILDNVDTYDENNTSNEMMPIQFFFNEKHVRDTSKKMKASVHSKRSNGNFLGSSAPYGYKKDPNNKYKLIIDEDASLVVKRIFEMFISGIGIKKICETLTRENIPIPSEYKNLKRGLKSSAYGIWGSRTVSDMLKLSTYVGDLTQGRLKKVSYKSKKIVRVNSKDWIVCKDACPQIIDRYTFDLAQNIYNRNKNQRKNTGQILLKGFVFCKECGHTIGFRLEKRQTKTKGIVNHCYGNCNYFLKYRKYKLCTPHNINYYELENIILNEIKKVYKQNLVSANLLSILKKSDNIENLKQELELKLKRLNAEIDNTDKKIDVLYNDKLNGIIDLELYTRTYDNIKSAYIKNKEEKKNIEFKISNIKKNIKEKEKMYPNILNEYISVKKPSIKLLSSIIDKIIIDENKNIEIYYKVNLKINNYIK